MKNILARLITNGSDLVESKNEIVRLVIATEMLIDAYDAGGNMIDRIRPIITAMVQSKHKLNRRRLYHNLNEVLVSEYMVSE